MNQLRRTLLRFAGGFAALAAVGLLRPVQAWAAAWNKTGFESKALADVLKSLGAASPAESAAIAISAPTIAENGAVVPIAVTSRIPNTSQIAIVAEKNPFPLAATFDIAGGSEAYISTRLKLGETSDVWALVKADGKFYVARQEIKITIGGCG